MNVPGRVSSRTVTRGPGAPGCGYRRYDLRRARTWHGVTRARRGYDPRSARSTTLVSSIARVIGPIPPGIGATNPATPATSGATSPV